MGMFKYLLGAMVGGIAGMGTGIVAFGGGVSGAIPAALVGVLAVKAFSGGNPARDLPLSVVRNLPAKRATRSHAPKKTAPVKKRVRKVLIKPPGAKGSP